MLNVSRTVPNLDAGLHIPVGLKIVALLAKTFVTSSSEQSKNLLLSIQGSGVQFRQNLPVCKGLGRRTVC